MADKEEPLYKRLVRTFPNFPTPGITFIDWMPVLENAEARRQLTDALLDLVKGYEFTKVAGLESRGFLLGMPIAERLGLGFVPIRKQGKLPGPCISETYELEYGTAAIEIQKDAIRKGDKILIADDLLATGGTMAAANRLISRYTTDIVDLFFIELEDLGGSKKLEYPYFSLYTTHE
jgi:adenine phosphoribosyltransferase